MLEGQQSSQQSSLQYACGAGSSASLKSKRHNKEYGGQEASGEPGMGDMESWSQESGPV